MINWIYDKALPNNIPSAILPLLLLLQIFVALIISSIALIYW